MTTNTDMYRSYTSDAGNLSRQLALVGAAIIWTFHGILTKSGNPLLICLNDWLVWSLYFICGSLLVDVIQYAVGSFLWYQEFDGSPDGDAKDSTSPITFANWTIGIKLSLMCIAYGFIFIFLLSTKLL